MKLFRKLFRNKKASELTEKIMLTAFAIAAAAAISVYTVSVISESKSANVDGLLGFRSANRVIPESEATEGLVYTLSGSEYKVTGYTGSSPNVSIPSTHEGLPVTELDQTFRGNSVIKTVAIGKGITLIGTKAFDTCPNLTSISIPDSVTEIGDHGISWNSSLETIVLPDSVQTIGNFAFYGKYDNLKYIYVPSSVTYAGFWSFCIDSSNRTLRIYIEHPSLPSSWNSSTCLDYRAVWNANKGMIGM